MNDYCSDSLHSKKLAQCLNVGCRHHVDSINYSDGGEDDITFTSYAYACGRYAAFKPFAEYEHADYPYVPEEVITFYELH